MVACSSFSFRNALQSEHQLQTVSAETDAEMDFPAPDAGSISRLLKPYLAGKIRFHRVLTALEGISVPYQFDERRRHLNTIKLRLFCSLSGF
ncbi:hypothetical protein [Corynebacterium diphtheriae]|uniref:hypothetical protein n=1 Tax=Corynebacterium diphtheriae TaxID=1717 RepID=UPI0012FFF5A3|nr:hypothetical protein [Corynebacterium diphtheriae]